MATPSQKSDAITNFLNRLTNRSSAIEEARCTGCGGPATEFKNAISHKEYTISGLCQNCQDAIFGREK